MIRKIASILKDFLKSLLFILSISIPVWFFMYVFSKTWGQGVLAKKIEFLFTTM